MFFFRRRFQKNVPYYSIPQVDLSVKPESTPDELAYLYENVTVDDSSAYLGHPDSVLLNNGNVLTFYPEGHGKGRIISKISVDGGKTYTEAVKNPPASWEKSLETPTVYCLQFTNGQEKLILISGNPKWPNTPTPGGWNCSISDDEGETWSEFKLFYDNKSDFPTIPVVSMASLTRLKENGQFVDKWMALFHNNKFENFKTILTFDENGDYHWSKPEKYLEKYRKYEKFAGICEVEAIRSDMGQGDEICLIARCNKKRCTSLLIFSNDEGKTWSEPVEAPVSLNGERHKADYTPDGRLFITFRSIERNADAYKKNNVEPVKRNWYSEGWVAWVGTYEDLKKGKEGQYRIKIAHTYLNNQDKPAIAANGDTGYCGNVVLPDGTVVTSSYGIFSPEEMEEGIQKTDKGKQKRRTYIVSKRIRLSDVDKLVNK